jgi:hypothetical protein
LTVVGTTLADTNLFLVLPSDRSLSEQSLMLIHH